MTTRRKFIKNTAIAASLIATQHFPYEAFARKTKSRKLTILHTNDVHSRLDPFPMDGGKYQGMGGVLVREKIISQIRNEEEHVLLLDAGDIFQGTPYFNFFKGEPEMKIMSMLGYNCATIGNHDFDNGIEALADQMQHANFPFVNCNYDFTNTALEDKVKPFTIIQKGNLKIGILGVGIELEGLVPDKLFKPIIYNNPIEKANRIANFLKTKKKCDFIICLSHLGFDSKNGKVCDKDLARDSEYMDLIIGGHTHTFLDEPYKTKNRKNQDVLVNQVGWGGIILGRLNIFFSNSQDSDYVSEFGIINVSKSSV